MRRSRRWRRRNMRLCRSRGRRRRRRRMRRRGCSRRRRSHGARRRRCHRRRRRGSRAWRRGRGWRRRWRGSWPRRWGRSSSRRRRGRVRRSRGRRSPLGRLLRSRLALGADFSGRRGARLRDDERRGLRGRYGAGIRQRRDGRGGKQHKTKFNHDGCGSKNRSEADQGRTSVRPDRSDVQMQIRILFCRTSSAGPPQFMRYSGQRRTCIAA